MLAMNVVAAALAEDAERAVDLQHRDDGGDRIRPAWVQHACLDPSTPRPDGLVMLATGLGLPPPTRPWGGR